MTVSAFIRQQVRARAVFACEYCGVTEIDTGGELSLDHFQPQSRGGSDEPENLIYCCTRCNRNKSDYWPADGSPNLLWNPGQDASAVHFRLLANGKLHPLTPVGTFTIRHLRLNREQLVAYRLRQQRNETINHLLETQQEFVQVLASLARQHLESLEGQDEVVEARRILLRLLLRQDL